MWINFYILIVMNSKQINISITILHKSELNESDSLLVDAAKQATLHSYAPYSEFYVGASVLLDNGIIVVGSNQENVAYPSGMCAERTAMFYANSQYPNVGVDTLCIAARVKDGTFTRNPISPCGACRQVLLETERRYGKNIRILLYGEDVVYCIHSVSDLLPIQFDSMIL